MDHGCANIPLVLKWHHIFPLTTKCGRHDCGFFIGLPSVRGMRSCSCSLVWSVCLVLLLVVFTCFFHDYVQALLKPLAVFSSRFADTD